jgi:Ulp1 family protease
MVNKAVRNQQMREAISITNKSRELIITLNESNSSGSQKKTEEPSNQQFLGKAMPEKDKPNQSASSLNQAFNLSPKQNIQETLPYANQPTRVMTVSSQLPIHDRETWQDINFLASAIESLAPRQWLESDPINLFSILDTQDNANIAYISAEVYHEYITTIQREREFYIPTLFRNGVSSAFKMLSKPLWIFMINHNNIHWQLLCVTNPETQHPSMMLLDSLNHVVDTCDSSHSNPANFESVKSFTCSYVASVLKEAKRDNYGVTEVMVKKCIVSYQPNSCDCGVFSLLNLKFVVEHCDEIIALMTSEDDEKVIDFSGWYNPQQGVGYRHELFNRYRTFIEMFSE